MSTTLIGKVFPIFTYNTFSVICRYKFNLMSGSSSSSKMNYQCDAEVQNLTSKLAQQTSRCVLFIKKIIQFCEDTFMYVYFLKSIENTSVVFLIERFVSIT